MEGERRIPIVTLVTVGMFVDRVENIHRSASRTCKPIYKTCKNPIQILHPKTAARVERENKYVLGV